MMLKSCILYRNDYKHTFLEFHFSYAENAFSFVIPCLPQLKISYQIRHPLFNFTVWLIVESFLTLFLVVLIIHNFKEPKYQSVVELMTNS